MSVTEFKRKSPKSTKSPKSKLGIEKLVFVGGLPRAGSTLIMNLLGQNPRLGITATSGVADLLYGMRHRFTNGEEFNAQDEKEMKTRFAGACKGALMGWADIEDAPPVYIDKSRAWVQFYEFLVEILGEDSTPKIIVPIRDLRGIVSSMEKLYRANQLRVDPIENPAKVQGLTVENRVKTWISGVPIGIAMDRVRDVYSRGVAKNMLFVKMEDLTKDPKGQLDRIYDYIGEKAFKHTFEDIKQITQEDDRRFGIPGLHTVQPKVEPIKEDWTEIIGPELSKGLKQGNMWYYERFYPDRV